MRKLPILMLLVLIVPLLASATPPCPEPHTWEGNATVKNTSVDLQSEGGRIVLVASSPLDNISHLVIDDSPPIRFDQMSRDVGGTVEQPTYIYHVRFGEELPEEDVSVQLFDGDNVVSNTTLTYTYTPCDNSHPTRGDDHGFLLFMFLVFFIAGIVSGIILFGFAAYRMIRSPRWPWIASFTGGLGLYGVGAQTYYLLPAYVGSALMGVPVLVLGFRELHARSRWEAWLALSLVLLLLLGWYGSEFLV